ncbi:MAG: tetratricopeptide repeat protein, partial [Ignavibacteriaceae bacterium]
FFYLRIMNSYLIFTIHSNRLAVLQDSITIELARILNLELQPDSRKVLTAGGTGVSEAYDYYLKGKGFLSNFDRIESIDTSITLFRSAIKEDKNYALAYAALGEAFWRKYRKNSDSRLIDSAKIYCNLALELNNQISQIHLTLGLINHGTGNYETALNDYKNALEFDPTNSEVYREMAKNYESLGELKAAETTYLKAIKLMPKYWANYNYLSVFYYKQGNYIDAIIQVKHVLNLRPDYINGYSNLGAFYFAINNWEEAQKTFEKSLSIKKTSLALNNLGVLNFYKGNFEKAAEMYNEALKLDEDDYQIWGHLAECYSNLDDQKNKSIPLYKKAIELAGLSLNDNPNDASLLSDLSNYYARLDDKQKAFSFLKRAEQQREIDPDIMFTIAGTYELLNERSSAIKWLNKSLENKYSFLIIEHSPVFKDLIQDKKFKTISEKFRKE